MRNKLLLLNVVLLLAGASAARAQGTVRRHLIYFRDKAGTPFSVTQPQAFLSARALARRSRQRIAVLPRDLPVNPAYVAQVRAVAGRPQVRYTSKWFNAALVACDSATLARIRALPIIVSAQTLNRTVRVRLPTPATTTAATQQGLAAATGNRADYGKAYAQAQLIGAVAMHDAGFRGEGMQVAVFDAGFPGYRSASVFNNLRTQNRILATRNFVDGGTFVDTRNGHGMNTLSTLASEEPGRFIGTAPRASYYLCITEDIDSEHPVEEANWLAAAEFADSAGVDVISSSLGYTEFDAPSPSYTYANMNGRTAISSRAAAVAARVGMLVVNANGNEGTSAWHYVSAPADADSVISVGATDSLGVKAAFSSFGPSSDGRIKPTLSAQGVASAVVLPNGAITRANGTSFACPEMAGLATGLWQANPQLSAQQIIQCLRSTATQAAAPDNSLGYGIPNFTRAAACATLAVGCPAAGVQVSAVTATSATLTFTGGPAGSSYQITTVPATTTQTVTTAPVQLSGLQPGTTYMVSIAGTCPGGLSAAVTTASLTTLSTPVLTSPLPAYLQLYPNPTPDGQLQLLLPTALLSASLQVRIIDAKGALVRHLTLDAPPTGTYLTTLDAGYLAKGTYICEVRANGNRQWVRFLQK